MEKEETEERLFFRYQKIDEYTKDNLKNNVLYFNDPENFNDPFDCKIDIIYQGTKEDWSNYILRYNIDPKEINQWIRDKKLRRKKNILILNRTKINDKLPENVFEKSFFRVCCFSATKLNILMWSHYAKNHQGICLCFKTYKNVNAYYLTLDSEPHILFPVKYDEDKPKKVNMLYGWQYLFGWDEIPGKDSERLIDFLKQKFSIDWVYSANIDKFDHDKTIRVYTDTNFLSLRLNDEKTRVNIIIDEVRTDILIANIENDMLNIYRPQSKELMDFFLTKYTDWDYENEYRITIGKDEFELGYTKKFRKQDLEGIIFGLNAERKKVKEIYEIINTHYLQQGIKVNFYSTHKIQGEFAIEVKKIESVAKYLKKLS